MCSNKMKKLTEKVHCEEQSEVVWLQRRDIEQPQQQQQQQQSTKLPIVYSKEYGVHFCGMEKLHPFDAGKSGRIFEYLKRSELLADGDFYEPEEITKEDLLKVHTKKYLRSLKWSLNAAKISEIAPLLLVPNYFVQRGYLRPMRFQAAGSILAAKLALQTGWAINLGGGFHHCCANRGGGFCAYADITLLICRLLEEDAASVRNVMIVDLDAHQGNGHERDFLHKPNVFIVDMYNSSIYPRDQPAKLAIRCAVELKPFTGDAVYMRKLQRSPAKLHPLVVCINSRIFLGRSLAHSLKEFLPDFVVYNAGTDVLKGDPLGMLAITPEGIIERDEFVFSTCLRSRIPLVMLLSGGYLKSSARVIADSIGNLKQKGLLGH